MKVPFIDLKQNYLSVKKEVLMELNEVLENTQYILGPKVSAFEKNFAKFHEVEMCYGTSSGTAANHLALWALDVGPGDEVILPSNTFIATAWGATLCGATPVFVDCDPGSYNINPDLIEAKITSRTKAIVAVHLYGQPADMTRIKAIAEKYNLYLVEDAAQAHGAEYNGQKVGGLGKIASFSFYPGKNLGAYGEGGAITTNDSALAYKIKIIREHGSEEKYQHIMLGHNYRMEGIQGAVLGVKLKYLEKWFHERRRKAGLYKKYLGDIKELRLPQESANVKHSYHLFVVVAQKRNALQAFLKSRQIETGLHYPIPLHLQHCFKFLGYQKGDFPVSEFMAQSSLSLPIFPEITEEQIIYVAEQIKSFYSLVNKSNNRIPFTESPRRDRQDLNEFSKIS
ncbi:MAG: DegT/DnrJ/EryC1/StrS family aminotransferase [Chitinophagaceae bacterium]